MNSLIRKVIPFSTAARIIIGLNLAVIGFHIAVLTQIIPFDVVWAGKLKTVNEMYVFESMSILINAALITAVISKLKSIGAGRSRKMVDILLWIFVALFALNTLGNLTAQASLEKYIATPLTFILALLCWRVAIEKSEAATV